MPGFRKSFVRHVRAIGADVALVKPYSLRRGGATDHFARHANMQATCEKGRWRQLPTARQYVDEASAEIARMEFSKSKDSKWKLAGIGG